MSKITIRQIESKSKQIFGKEDFIHTSTNLWKSYGKKEVCLGIWRSSGGIRSFAAAIIVMDYSLKVLRVEHCDNKKLVSFLVGKKLDSKSLESTELHDKAKGVGHSQIIGKITDKGAVLFNKANFLASVKKETTTMINGKPRAMDNTEFVDIFKTLCKKYKSSIKSFWIDKDGSEEVSVRFETKGKTFTLKLWKFLSGYNLKLSMNNVKNDQSMNLHSRKLSPTHYERIITEFLTGKLSNMTKAYFITNGYKSELDSYEYQELNKNTLSVSIKYSSYCHPVHGKYTYHIDLNKKKVTCIDGEKSTKFIPREIERMEERLLNL